MDQSVVQQILDNANTRGTAILMRTIREILRDRKIILVAFVSLLPIMIGVLWSATISDNEDIRSEDIQNVSDTSDIFCYVDVPDYLPNSGNYSFIGEVHNKGDTAQEIAVNMTLGNSRTASAGIRKTTGIMRVEPLVSLEDSEFIREDVVGPTRFSITYDMDDFKDGTTFIVIQMYVNNSVTSTRLRDLDEYDLTVIDFEQFNLEAIVGRNAAVQVNEIEIRQASPLSETTNELYIGTETEIMPLSIRYPTLMTPSAANVLHLSITNPLNNSLIRLQLTLPSEGSTLANRIIGFDEDLDVFNFTLTLPENFSELGFDKEFHLRYRIDLGGDASYTRNGMFSMDLVKEEFLDLSENRTLVMEFDTLYSGTFDYPTTIVEDYQNSFRYDLMNDDIISRTFRTNVTLRLDQYNYTNFSTSYHSFFADIQVGANRNATGIIDVPTLLSELYNDTYYFQRIEVIFSVEVNGQRSVLYETDDLTIRSFDGISKIETVALEDTFTTSLRSIISLPEDLSLKRSTYNVTCTIINMATIEKDFHAKLTVQGNEYTSDIVTVGAGEKGNITIMILTDDLSKEFNEQVKVEVFSSRTLEADDPEARTTVEVNIISQGHKERQVLENFLFVYVHLYMKFIVPLVAMVYGISLISHESESRTLALYLTTPITKAELILYKFGGYLIAMTAILAVPLILIYISFSYVLSMDLMIYYLLLLGVCLFDLFLAVAAYGAVFTAIGTIERHPVFLGLSYLMVWEVFMGSFGIFLSQFTVFYHIRNAVLPFTERYVPNAVESMGLLDWGGNDFTIPMEMAMIAITLVVIVFLAIAVNILSKRDVG